MGDESAVLFDYRRRTAFGSVTRTVAADATYWREIVFPFALGVMSPVLRTVPLHAACLRYRNQGVLIGARSGAGKSTLAATLARRGIEFISDDWVYLTSHNGLRAHAMPVSLKLLPDATAFFPELRAMAPAESQNGEWSIAFDPAEIFGASRAYRCEPHVVILFERVPGADLRIREARTEDLIEWFSEPLDCVPACLEMQRQAQVELICKLRTCRCYVVTCDGTPDKIADDILRVCDSTVCVAPSGAQVQPARSEHLDLLRRAELAPHTSIVDIGGVGVAVRTNHAAFLEQFSPASSQESEIDATVIVENEPWPGSGASSIHLSDLTGYVSLGCEGFLAFDSEHREVAAFVSETAVRTGRVRHELLRLCDRIARTVPVTT